MYHTTNTQQKDANHLMLKCARMVKNQNSVNIFKTVTVREYTGSEVHIYRCKTLLI